MQNLAAKKLLKFKHTTSFLLHFHPHFLIVGFKILVLAPLKPKEVAKV